MFQPCRPILVSFIMNADDEGKQEDKLMFALENYIDHGNNGPIDSFWVAEDDSLTKTDLEYDSAIFVPHGKQAEALAALELAGILPIN